MKKEKIRYWSDEQLVSYLERMARQGWFPTVFSDYYVFLTESTIKHVRFTIDYCPSIYKATESIKKNFTEYLENNEEAGWHHITSHDSRHLFYSEDLFPNEMIDDSLKWDSLKKQQRNYVIISCCLLILFSSFIYYQLKKLDILLTWTGLGYIGGSLLGIVACLITLFMTVKYYLTIKPNDDFNKSFNNQTNRYLQLMPKLYHLSFFLIILTLFIFSFIDSIWSGSISSNGLPICSVLLIQSIVKFSLEYTGYNSKQQLKKVSGIIFLIEIVFLVSLNYWLDDMQPPTPQANTIVTIQDLSNGEVATDHSSYSELSSPFVKKSLIYKESSNLHDLTFKAHETDSSLIKQYIYQHYLNFIKDKVLSDSSTIEKPTNLDRFSEIITIKNTSNDLYILATIDSNVIFLKYYNPLLQTSEILEKVASTLNSQ